MDEDYVSLEVAKLLRKKGFVDDGEFACPTLMKVHKWLLEKGIRVHVKNYYNKKNSSWQNEVSCFHSDDNSIRIGRISYHNTYEQALDAGIMEALTYLEDKNHDNGKRKKRPTLNRIESFRVQLEKWFSRHQKSGSLPE